MKRNHSNSIIKAVYVFYFFFIHRATSEGGPSVYACLCVCVRMKEAAAAAAEEEEEEEEEEEDINEHVFHVAQKFGVCSN